MIVASKFCIVFLTYSDFMVKIIDIKDNSQQKTIRGHDGPILSVAFDPKDVFLVITLT